MKRLSACLLGITVLACACKEDSESSSSIAKAVDPAAREQKQESPPPVAEPDEDEESDELANPWTFDEVRDALAVGTKVIYARGGTNAKGKKVDDQLTYVVRSVEGSSAGTSYTIEPDPGTNEASSQVAKTSWSDLSPFFAMDRVEQKVVARETVEVPAGSFETVKIELKDFFGNEKTVWMIPDQPGIYAKVVDHGNAGDEGDKTELTYGLVEVQRPGG